MPRRSSKVVLTAVAVCVTACLSVVGPTAAKPPFVPKNGFYTGPYANPYPGEAKLGIVVGVHRFGPGKPQPAVSLRSWGGKATCADGSTRYLAYRMDAPRKGKQFSFNRTDPPVNGVSQHLVFSGKFTAKDKLKGFAQVSTSSDAASYQCDTGQVKFTAKWKNG